jgi:Uma2 family endonuclease
MTLVSTSTKASWPAEGRPFTAAELDRLPADGRRYELLDGVLVVSPRPAIPHQEIVAELLGLLRSASPAGLRAIPEPGVHISATTELAPYIAVIRQEQLAEHKITEPPELVVEVRSPSTALIDLNRKKQAYERFGVPSYWVAVPDLDKPELVAFELSGGHYRQVAHVRGEERFTAARPFTVDIAPARLVAGLLPG